MLDGGGEHGVLRQLASVRQGLDLLVGLQELQEAEHQRLVLDLDGAGDGFLDEAGHILPGLVVGHEEESEQLLDEVQVVCVPHAGADTLLAGTHGVNKDASEYHFKSN